MAESNYKQKAQNDYDEANKTYTILYETRKLKVGNTGRNADEATTEGLNTQEGNEEISNRSEHSWD